MLKLLAKPRTLIEVTGGPKNKSVMVLPVHLCDACEFTAQWEQSQVHHIDINACIGCETTAGVQ